MKLCRLVRNVVIVRRRVERVFKGALSGFPSPTPFCWWNPIESLSKVLCAKFSKCLRYAGLWGGCTPETSAPFSRQNTNDMVSCVSAMNGATNLQNIKVTYFSTKNMKCGCNVFEKSKASNMQSFRSKWTTQTIFMRSYLAENCSFKCKEEIIHKHKTYARAARCSRSLNYIQFKYLKALSCTT